MKKSENTVLWWIGWIVLTIVSFFVSCYFWTGWISEHVGPLRENGASILWVIAVFGSWMVLLVPLIIVMYSKVDKTYEDARLSREAAQLKKAREEFPARSQCVDPKERKLSPELVKIVKKIPETIPQGHLVTAVLKDGRTIRNVFIAHKKEVLGVYDCERLDFNIQDIVSIQQGDQDPLPSFEIERWLRLDAAPEDRAS